MLLDPFLEALITGLKYLLVIEGQVCYTVHIMPVQFVVEYIKFMMLDIYQGTISDRYNPASRVAVRGAECVYLLQVNII